MSNLNVNACVYLTGHICQLDQPRHKLFGQRRMPGQEDIRTWRLRRSSKSKTHDNSTARQRYRTNVDSAELI